MTETLTTGKRSDCSPSGSAQPRVCSARPSSRSSSAPHIPSASVSLTTASPNKSTVKPMLSRRRLRSVFMTSSGFRPAMNCRAMPETFQRRMWPLSHGRMLGRAQTGLHHRRQSRSIPAKYSRDAPRCRPPRRSDASTSTKRNICTLKCLVPHRERHHPLIKSGFAEDRFRVLIDQVENLLAAPFHGDLKSLMGRG